MRALRSVLAVAFAALCAPAAAAAADPPLWGVNVVAAGTYSLDYGDDGDAIDGQGSGRWDWTMKAVADGLSLDTGTAIFRMKLEEGSDIVLEGQTPSCRPPAGAEIAWVRDSRAGLFLSSSGGFQVNHPFFDLFAGCHVGAHGMSLYDGASPAETRVPRAAFRPRRDGFFKRTWTQEIVLDPSHESGTPHSFYARGTITIRLKRLTKPGARILERRLRAVRGAG